MPSNATRQRIDYMPGDAAMEALQIGEQLLCTLPRQEVLDKLVITGLWALQQPPWVLPPLLGKHRDRWRLPPSIRRALPGDSSTPAGIAPADSREHVQSSRGPGIMHNED